MKNENLVKFGERLKELRKSSGKTQVYMAELLHCTSSNYQKMEYGRVNVPAATIIFLANYFDVSTDYLLGLSEKRERA